MQSLLNYKEGVACENGIYRYQDFKAIREEENIRLKSPHIVVQDYGADIMGAAEDVEAGMTILVAGGRPWELEAGIHAYERLSDEENLTFVCNYNDRQMAKKYAGILQKKVYGFPLDKDPFAISEVKNRLFQQMFGERRG